MNTALQRHAQNALFLAIGFAVAAALALLAAILAGPFYPAAARIAVLVFFGSAVLVVVCGGSFWAMYRILIDQHQAQGLYGRRWDDPPEGPPQ